VPSGTDTEPLPTRVVTAAGANSVSNHQF